MLNGHSPKQNYLHQECTERETGENPQRIPPHRTFSLSCSRVCVELKFQFEGVMVPHMSEASLSKSSMAS